MEVTLAKEKIIELQRLCIVAIASNATSLVACQWIDADLPINMVHDEVVELDIIEYPSSKDYILDAMPRSYCSNELLDVVLDERCNDAAYLLYVIFLSVKAD